MKDFIDKKRLEFYNGFECKIGHKPYTEDIWLFIEDVATEAYEKGIKEAKSYAEEMCKRQREICAKALFKHRIKELDEILDEILTEPQKAQVIKIKSQCLTAPLATEVK